MIHLTGLIFLYVAGFIGCCMLLLSVAHLYHAIRYGSRDPLAMTMTGVYIAGIIAILWITVSLATTVNWTQSVDASLPTLPTTQTP